MPFKTLPLFLLLFACTSPSPSLLGAPATDITVGSSRFRVYHYPGASRVEAHRINLEFLPFMSHIRADAYQAIERTTGCSIRSGSFVGDQAVVKAEVNC
ncbi:MAG: hypothetical protein ACU0CA_15380 [Paracoccaceae bacterium]